MGANPPASPEIPGEPRDLESTFVLVRRAQSGERIALDRLCARYLPALRRFAHGRLSPSARRICDTNDLVQDAMYRALGSLERFQPGGPGSFLGWLRAIVLHRLTDVVRSAAAGSGHVELGESLENAEPSPLDQVVTREELAVFESALERLTAEKQEAVILFVEMGCSYAEIAGILGKASANTARMTVQRGLRDLARVMKELGVDA